MPKIMQDLIEKYVEAVKKIYGSHVRQIILYGSYARGDFRPDSDVDIMILVDMSDLELKAYAQQLSYMTYDFNIAMFEELLHSNAHLLYRYAENGGLG
ncbi:nucleotidyltransferase domain-containing protein [Fusicatenibacter sp.]